MRIAYLLLADHALAADDGRLYLIGGGIDRLGAAQFPVILPHLSLAMKFYLDPAEAMAEHTIQVRLVNPNDKPIISPMGQVLAPSSPLAPIPSPYHFVYNIRDVPFQDAGHYQLSVEFDQRELGPLPLTIEVSETPSPSLRNQLDSLSSALVSGYQQFARGDVAGSLSTFERLMMQFPKSAEAHNNYGYLLLSTGDISGAFEQFQLAQLAGPMQSELVAANLACCLFSLGQIDEAMARFVALLRATMRSTHSTLFGLGRETMQPVFLTSQADFVALMGLNSGRCAVAGSSVALAEQYLHIAETGLVTMQGPTRDVFETLLRELQSDLPAPTSKSTSQGP